MYFSINWGIIEEIYKTIIWRNFLFSELLGVLMTIKDGYVVNKVDIDADSEQVWARVKLPGDKPLHICSFYRPPSSGMNPLCDLENSIEKITQPGQNLVIAGDFNCGDVDWDGHSSTAKQDAYRLCS